MKVVVLEAYSLAALMRLRGRPDLEVSQDPGALPSAEALLIRSRTVVNQPLLDRTPNLKLVITSTSGFDHIDWRACRGRGITVAFTPEANANATAELTLLLMLATERRLLNARRNVREGKWREGLGRPHGLAGLEAGNHRPRPRRSSRRPACARVRHGRLGLRPLPR